MRIISVKNKQIFLAIAIFLSVCTIFFIGNLKAEESNVKLIPIPRASSALSPNIKSKQATADPAVTEIAARLRDHVTTIGKGAKQLDIRQNQPSALQNKALEQLRDRVGAGFKVMMSNAGTPRQIKGKMLEPVVQKAVPKKDRDKITAQTFLRSNHALLGIDDPDNELILYKRQTDHLDMSHLRFSQEYLGLPVWPAELIIHCDPAGNVYLMNGAYISTPKKIDTKPAIEAEAAVKLARKEIVGDSGADASKPELIIYAPGDRDPRLAWKMEISVSLASNWLVVVDALNGSILTAYNQVMDTGAAGSGVDLFGGTQSINLWKEGATFYMVDTSKQMFDPTSGPPNPDTTKGAIIIMDAQNQPPTADPQSFPSLSVHSSTSATSGWVPDAVSALVNFSTTYDYFLDRHGRNSLDDNGGTLLAVVRFGKNFPNAFFNSEAQLMAFGDALPYAGALDVVAHELAHGVTNHTAQLIYQYQSGAMNEAFSDIFGESVEARTKGRHDWLIGDIFPITNRRSMSDPSSLEFTSGYSYPSKMSEYFNTDQDNGGVHINSGIINRAFYLLAEGLTGAIGDLDAEKIFYRALTTHLVKNSQFTDGRLACIQSAEELFGAGSNQALKTAEAFDAVEIFDSAGTPEPPTIPPVDSSDSTLFMFYLQSYNSYFLARQEDARGDGASGTVLASNGSAIGAASTRPTVSGDGSFAIYVDSTNDLCFYNTDGQSSKSCLGFPGRISSVAVSPDGQIYSFVLLDDSGNPFNSIAVIDLSPGGGTKQLSLVAPALDGTSINTILRAGTMDFSIDGQLLIYDALNRIQLSNGSNYDVWSIYAMDLKTERTFMIVPPSSGLTIGFPALGQTSDSFITFDVHNDATGQSTVYAGNLNTGDLSPIATVNSGFGVPGFTGDDTAIVYSQFNTTTQTQFSLMQQPLGADHISPSGQPTLRLPEGDFGVIYRRGTFTASSPVPDIKANGSNGPLTLSSSDNLSVTVELDPGMLNGQGADWWVVVYTTLSPPYDWLYLNLNSGWTPGLSVTLQGQLYSIPLSNILNTPVSMLPAGTYTFLFAVDTLNGTIDFDKLYIDSVEVTVTQ